jgi:Zn-dependent peptidase ImmA (M78 family)/transcriptional regulator with XRE-family HTH domain
MKITLQPAILEWARERAGLSEVALAKKLTAKPEQVEKWEEDGNLTYKRAEKLAKVTHTPFGYLFLSAPPEEKLPVADFRTLASEEKGRPSPELLDVLYDAMRKQDWYREHLLELGEDPVRFVGSATMKTEINELADAIRRDFKFNSQLRAAAANWEQALSLMFDHCEDQGVMVIRSGIADGNTHRPLSVEEFRGFALTDPYAPLVFINSKDSPAGQMFTLVHELVHLWLGLSGVSNLNQSYANTKRVEIYCNAVAAEVLVPLAELKDALKDGLDTVPALKKRFKVSSLVILRRLHDAKQIDRAQFQQLYQAEEVAFATKRDAQASGGNYYATQRVRSGGSRFARALIASTLEGRTPYREAQSLLGIKKVATFKKFATELKFGSPSDLPE